MMFGYATDETEEYMPLTCVLAHQLNEKLAELRRNGVAPWLRPDSKTQVSAVGIYRIHLPYRAIPTYLTFILCSRNS